VLKKTSAKLPLYLLRHHSLSRLSVAAHASQQQRLELRIGGVPDAIEDVMGHGWPSRHPAFHQRFLQHKKGVSAREDARAIYEACKSNQPAQQ
jgi:hypothetical protein